MISYIVCIFDTLREFIFYYILVKQLRFSKQITLVVLFIESLLDYFISVFLPEQMQFSYMAADFLLIILFSSIQTLIFKSNIFKWRINFTIHLILNIIYGVIATVQLFVIESFSLNNSLLSSVSPFIFQFTSFILFLAIAKFIQSKISTIENNITSEYFYILLFPSILQYCIYDFYFVYGSHEYLILFILSIFATITLIITLYRQLKISEERTQNIIFTNLLKTSKEQMNQMIENEDALKEIRHDLKNHLIVMQGLLKDKQYNQLEIYLNDITPMFDVHQPKIYCQNIYLNTLLNHKVAEYQNIDFHIQIHPSFCTHFSDVDLYILISNLLDNAIQELSIHPSLIQEIEILLTIEEAFQIIKIRNPLSQTKTLKTEKIDSENHGIGLSIIKKLVKKYDGEMLIHQDAYFEVKIVFCLE